MKRLLLVGAMALAMVSTPAFARGRFRGFYGPRLAPYGWYGYGPYWGFYGYYPYDPWFGTPSVGQVKVDTKVKDAEVFIDGSFAGTVGQLKTMTLLPGSYSIAVRAPGRVPFEQKVYVVPGKTTKLHPGLQLETSPGTAG